MDISIYFNPIERSVFEEPDEKKALLGNVVERYLDKEQFPSLDGKDIAIIGIPEDRNSINNKGCCDAPDWIRKKFYQLKPGDYPYKVVDLGNLIIGATAKDTYHAVGMILADLIKEKIVPIILGGSQDITFGQYLAYGELQQTVNIVSVDSHFDLGQSVDEMNSNTYLGRIILHEPSFLFNYSNVGYQTYFAGHNQVELMKKLYFDIYRLGQVQQDLEEVEPIVRNADILSFDIGCIRQSDAPGNRNASPNGFYGEEACQIVRYAGMSDKLSTVGFYEVNPKHDNRDQTSHLTAQMLWYFIDGYYNRKNDAPMTNKSGFLKYRVALKQEDHEIVFYKSKKSGRWWMEVPYASSKKKFTRHHLIPCSYRDYEVAMKDEMPERWWQALKKLN
jgi:arginase family enzyme